MANLADVINYFKQKGLSYQQAAQAMQKMGAPSSAIAQGVQMMGYTPSTGAVTSALTSTATPALKTTSAAPQVGQQTPTGITPAATPVTSALVQPTQSLYDQYLAAGKANLVQNNPKYASAQTQYLNPVKQALNNTNLAALINGYKGDKNSSPLAYLSKMYAPYQNYSVGQGFMPQTIGQQGQGVSSDYILNDLLSKYEPTTTSIPT